MMGLCVVTLNCECGRCVSVHKEDNLGLHIGCTRREAFTMMSSRPDEEGVVGGG